MDVGPVDGVVHEGFDRVGDGLDHEPGREDADADPVVRLQPLAEEGNGEKPTPNDWRAPKKAVLHLLRHLHWNINVAPQHLEEARIGHEDHTQVAKTCCKDVQKGRLSQSINSTY